MINQQLKADEIRNSEKNRIAKDLHDGIMNKLTSTRLNLFVLSKKSNAVAKKRLKTGTDRR